MTTATAQTISPCAPSLTWTSWGVAPSMGRRRRPVTYPPATKLETVIQVNQSASAT